MSSVVMALDSGTTSIRAILFDHDGEVVAAASQEFPQIYPQPGWVCLLYTSPSPRDS